MFRYSAQRSHARVLTVRVGMAFVLLAAATTTARAQVLSFSADGTRRLTELVASNKEAADLFRSLQRTADEALQQKPQPVRQLLTEGRLDSDPAKRQTKEALAEMPKIYALGQEQPLAPAGRKPMPAKQAAKK